MSAVMNRKSVFTLVAVGLVGLAGAARAAAQYRPTLPPPPSRPAAPQYGYNQEREAWRAQDIRAAFPRLGENFEIVGPRGEGKNAYGHALGLDCWVNPEAGTADNPLAGM